jgi:hypothetical protein
MEFDEFVNKAKKLVIDKRITNRNVKIEWLKTIYKLNLHENYLRDIEKIQNGGLTWDTKLIEHHKQQILKD